MAEAAGPPANDLDIHPFPPAQGPNEGENHSMPTAAKTIKAYTSNAKQAGQAKKISRTEVARRAYFLWLKHGQQGRELDDWLQAERELHRAARKPIAKAQTPAKPAAKAPAAKSAKPAAPK